MSTRDDADYRKALTDAIATALEQRAKLERAIAAGIQQQIELYDKSFAPTSQVLAARLAKDGVPAEQQARQSSEQSKADGEVLPPALVGKLVAADAHDYRKLKDPHHKAEAALAMAETARVNPGYCKALAEKAPDVSDAVHTAMLLTNKSEEVRSAPASASVLSTPRYLASDATRDPAMTRGPEALERTTTHRAQDVDAPPEQLTLNGIEQVIQRKSADRERQTEEKHPAPESAKASQPKAATTRDFGANQVASDEVFTATKDEAKPIVPMEVEARYLRVDSKFYYPRNTSVVAFEDKGNKLETRSNSEQIAETMVMIARARGWDEIKVTGSETFRRKVWLEAAAHGMQVKGYTPSEVDKAALAKRSGDIAPGQMKPEGGMRGAESRSEAVAEPDKTRSARTSETKKADNGGQGASTDPATDGRPATEDLQRARAFAQKSATEALREYPELAGAYAAMASMKKRVAADGLSPQQRAVVMARVEANLVSSVKRGELPDLKVREQVEALRQHTVNREVKQ